MIGITPQRFEYAFGLTTKVQSDFENLARDRGAA